VLRRELRQEKAPAEKNLGAGGDPVVMSLRDGHAHLLVRAQHGEYAPLALIADEDDAKTG
jgi:hypothetical protein